MRKVLTFLAIMLLPLSVWAMTPVSDSDLSNVTGQAGVNINVDMTMDVNIGTMAWGDADGIAGVYNPWTTATMGTGGYVGMSNFNITALAIHARTDSDDQYNSYNTLMLKPFTIDVATNATDSTSKSGKTFVRIGLGATKIDLPNGLSFDVALWKRESGGAAYSAIDKTTEQDLGVVTIGPMAMYINPMSYVDIFSHGAMGVSFDVNVTLDRISMGTISWGDTDGDGFGGATGGSYSTGSTTWAYWPTGSSSAGYVGLRNFNLGDATTPAITMNGTVAIDVATSSLGFYGQLPGLVAAAHSHMELVGLDPTNYAQAAAVTNAALYYIAHGSMPAGTPVDVATAAGQVAADLGTMSTGGFAQPTTVVHISFPDASGFQFNVSKIAAEVVLGNTARFTGPTGVLGDIYLDGLNMKVYKNSFIDIWAH